MNVMILVDGTPKEIADLLSAVRNRQNSDVKVSLKTRTGKQELCRECIGDIYDKLDKKPDICSPLSTLEDSVKAVFSVDNEKLKKDIRKAIDDTLEEEPK